MTEDELVARLIELDEQEQVIWELCTGPCGREYRYPYLCRKHMLCGICHEGVPL